MIKRGWGRDKKWYPEGNEKELKLFIGMHKRIAKDSKLSTVWARSPNGFRSFMRSVGKIPTKMIRPSLGRKNHDKPYQPGNCKWQEYAENALEGSRLKKGRVTRSLRLKALWADKKYRKRMSKICKSDSLIRAREKDGTFSSGAIR